MRWRDTISGKERIGKLQIIMKKSEMCIRDSLRTYANSPTISPFNKNRFNIPVILSLIHISAVVSAWQEDLNSHIDFEGWQFISRNTELTYE